MFILFCISSSLVISPAVSEPSPDGISEAKSDALTFCERAD